MKKGLASDKSFRKTFGRKKRIQSNQEFSKSPEYQQDWHQKCKSNPINMRDKVKARPSWQSEVSPKEKRKKNERKIGN